MAEAKRLIPVARPLMDEREVEAAGRAIRSAWVTQGREVAAFENEVAAYVGADHACAVSSGTTALHLALLPVPWAARSGEAGAGNGSAGRTGTWLASSFIPARPSPPATAGC